MSNPGDIPRPWMAAVWAYRRAGIIPRAESAQAARELLEAGECLFCSRGDFRMIASHTSQVHGVTADELRVLALTPQGFVSPEVHERKSVLARLRREVNPAFAAIPATKGKNLKVTPVRKAANRAKAIRLAHDPRRLEAQRAAMQRPDVRAKLIKSARRASAVAALKNARPHPCSNCGTIIPKGERVTCSDACFRERIALGWANTKPYRYQKTQS